MSLNGEHSRTFRVNHPVFLLFVVVVVSHIQRIGCQPEKLLYTVANPARGLLNREKRTKEKSLAAYPPPPPTLLVRRKYIKSRDASTGATQVLVGLASVQRYFGSSTRPMAVASQNSTLPSAIIRFPVSLLLSSPGDV